MKDDIAPDITVADIFTGEEVKLSNYKGKVIFVEFWATWCGPCQSPTSKLCEMASKRKNDWVGKAALLCISIDEKKEDVINHVRNRGWLAVRHLWCHKGEPGWKSDAAQKFGIAGVPTALLIDQSGNIVWRGHPASFDIEAKIDELLSRERKNRPVGNR
jgi:thiol-disulfide isomerase/thioredoxin